MKLIKRIIRLPFNILNNLVKKTNWYKNTIPDISIYPGDKWYRDNLERNFDAVNLGSSSALYAFDYSSTRLKAFNWAMQPQSMDYSFKVLKQYFSILKKGGIVIIPFCPFSALSTKGKWPATYNDRYYYFLDPVLIDDYEQVALRRKYPLKAFPKASIKHLIKDAPAKRANISTCNSDKEFENDAAKWITMWSNEFNITNLDADISNENKAGMQERRTTIENMLDFCIERDLRPIIVIPPMHPALSRKFSNTFRNNYIHSFLSPICEKHNVIIKDYIRDKRFTANALFYNSFFMSKEGAQLFTKTLFEEI